VEIKEIKINETCKMCGTPLKDQTYESWAKRKEKYNLQA
jgi:hypothetical protein